MSTTELLTDPGHVREDLRQMEAAVRRSVQNPEIPIPAAVIEAMPKVAGTILLKGTPREQLRAGSLLLAFMEYNKALNAPPPQQPVVQVGVQVNGNPQSGRTLASQIVQRIRLGGVSSVDSGGSIAVGSGGD